MSRSGGFVRRWLAAASLCGLVVIAASAPGLTQTPPRPSELTRVRFALLSLPFGSYSQFTIAKEQGLFARNGLEVEFVPVDTSPNGLAALASGAVQFSFTGPNIVDAVVAGIPVVVVFAVGNAPNVDICAGPTIRTAQDLIGKAVATLNRGSAPDMALRLWLQNQGLTEQVTVRNINAGMAALAAAMESGAAVAFAGTSTGITSCRTNPRGGTHMLVDLAENGVRFFNTGVAVTRDYLEAHRPTVKSFVAALIEAEKVFKEDREIAFRTLIALDKETDPKILEYNWNFIKTRWPDPATVNPEAMLTAIRSNLNEKTREIGPAMASQMYDNSVVLEVVGK
jgi:NitT/TauT family transport system substrate-binding protein